MAIQHVTRDAFLSLLVLQRRRPPGPSLLSTFGANRQGGKLVRLACPGLFHRCQRIRLPRDLRSASGLLPTLSIARCSDERALFSMARPGSIEHCTPSSPSGSHSGKDARAPPDFARLPYHRCLLWRHGWSAHTFALPWSFLFPRPALEPGFDSLDLFCTVFSFPNCPFAGHDLMKLTSKAISPPSIFIPESVELTSSLAPATVSLASGLLPQGTSLRLPGQQLTLADCPSSSSPKLTDSSPGEPYQHRFIPVLVFLADLTCDPCAPFGI